MLFITVSHYVVDKYILTLFVDLNLLRAPKENILELLSKQENKKLFWKSHYSTSVGRSSGLLLKNLQSSFELQLRALA